MKARNFPSYRFRHAIRMWRVRRYHRRNSLFYPPEEASKEDLVRLPPSEDLESRRRA